MSVGVNNVPSM